MYLVSSVHIVRSVKTEKCHLFRCNAASVGDYKINEKVYCGRAKKLVGIKDIQLHFVKSGFLDVFVGLPDEFAVQETIRSNANQLLNAMKHRSVLCTNMLYEEKLAPLQQKQ